MKVNRFAIGLVLLAASALAPALSAQEEKAGSAPWVSLSGSERRCTRFEQQIGGKICFEWDTAQREFLLGKDGSASQRVQLGHTDSQGPTTTPTVLSRGGRLAPPEIRSFRNLLANIGIAGLKGECNPFGGAFQTVPFQEGADYELLWNGPNGTRVKLPLLSRSTGTPCPQGLLRLLHRINLISAGLPNVPIP